MYLKRLAIGQIQMLKHFLKKTAINIVSRLKGSMFSTSWLLGAYFSFIQFFQVFGFLL